MKHLLWIAPRWIFPTDDGAKRASLSLLEPLAAAGHTISFVALSREEIKRTQNIPNLTLIKSFLVPKHSKGKKIQTALKNLGSDLPLSSAPYAEATKNFSWSDLRLLLKSDPDYVVFDSLHGYGGFLEDCPWPIVYRSHNVEAKIWQQAKLHAPLLAKPYFSLQAKRVAKIEKKICTKAYAIAAISPEDKKIYEESYPGKRLAWVPVGFPVPPALPSDPILRVGFLGRLDWPPNREGLQWFLEKVWPQVHAKKPELRFLIAGSGDSAWLQKQLPLPGVEFLGFVEKLEDYYKKIQLSVVPIHFGSGTKIKLVESAMYGRAILSTEHGVSGSGLATKHMLAVSDRADDWIHTLDHLDPEQLAKLGEQSQKEATKVFSAAGASEVFLRLLE